MHSRKCIITINQSGRLHLVAARLHALSSFARALYSWAVSRLDGIPSERCAGRLQLQQERFTQNNMMTGNLFLSNVCVFENQLADPWPPAENAIRCAGWLF